MSVLNVEPNIMFLLFKRNVCAKEHHYRQQHEADRGSTSDSGQCSDRIRSRMVPGLALLRNIDRSGMWRNERADDCSLV